MTSSTGVLRLSPYAEHLWFLAGSSDVRLPDEAADVRDGPDGGGNEPRQAESGANPDEDGDDE